MFRKKTAILFCSFLVFACVACHAEDSLAKRGPQAILVQLRSEHNRITALTADGKNEAAEEVRKDAAGVTKAMVRDFKDHFTFCPVYYFMDTNADKIKNKVFDGVLMNADGTPAKKTALKKYQIVYYGYPTGQSRMTKLVKDPNKYQYDSGEPMGKGLIINDSDFYQVSFLYKFGFDDLYLKSKSNRPYYYQSKHYDMEYFPFAKRYSDALKSRHKKIRIQHARGYI